MLLESRRGNEYGIDSVQMEDKCMTYFIPCKNVTSSKVWVWCKMGGGENEGENAYSLFVL